MLIRPDTSLLLHIDLQERLMPAIDGGDTVIANAIWLTRIARQLCIPVGATVQYPKGLGATVPALSELLLPGETIEKINFSAMREGDLAALAGFERPQIVITGCEAHVCVLQTALDLHATGKQVFLVADATGSRRADDKALAIERMRAAGVTIVSREMVAFEWLQRANNETFREISRNFLRYTLGTMKIELLLVNPVRVGWTKKMQDFKHWSGCTSGVSRSCDCIAKGLA